MRSATRRLAGSRRTRASPLLSRRCGLVIELESIMRIEGIYCRNYQLNPGGWNHGKHTSYRRRSGLVVEVGHAAALDRPRDMDPYVHHGRRRGRRLAEDLQQHLVSDLGVG